MQAMMRALFALMVLVCTAASCTGQIHDRTGPGDADDDATDGDGDLAREPNPGECRIRVPFVSSSRIQLESNWMHGTSPTDREWHAGPLVDADELSWVGPVDVARQPQLPCGVGEPTGTQCGYVFNAQDEGNRHLCEGNPGTQMSIVTVECSGFSARVLTVTNKAGGCNGYLTN